MTTTTHDLRLAGIPVEPWLTHCPVCGEDLDALHEDVIPGGKGDRELFHPRCWELRKVNFFKRKGRTK